MSNDSNNNNNTGVLQNEMQKSIEQDMLGKPGSRNMMPQKKTSNDFFYNVFGFSEHKEYDETQRQLLRMATFTNTTSQVTLDREANGPTDGNKRIVSVVKERCVIKTPEREIDCGTFWTPSVEELRAEVAQTLADPSVVKLLEPFRQNQGSGANYVTVSHIVGDSRKLHASPSLRNALFQAASQFNYLEFPGPRVVPEHGITGYVFDGTQGPACAIACAGGTAYRNYLATVCRSALRFMLPDGTSQRGQRAGLQFNGLAEAERVLPGTFFFVKNGYVDSDKEKLAALHTALQSQEGLAERFMAKIRIGVQQDTEVTDVIARGGSTSRFLVTQTYNSAISVGYSRCSPEQWKDIATLVLCATYEATMLVAILHTINVLRRDLGRAKPPPILLTKVGGGVFGNQSAWIRKAMQLAFRLAGMHRVPLDVRITHFGSVDPDYSSLLT